MKNFGRSVVMGLGIALGMLVIGVIAITGLGAVVGSERQAAVRAAATATSDAEFAGRSPTAQAAYRLEQARGRATVESARVEATVARMQAQREAEARAFLGRPIWPNGTPTPAIVP